MSTTARNLSAPELLIATGFVVSVIMAGVCTYFIPKVSLLFSSNGIELPTVTIMALKVYPVMWMLPLTVIGVALLLPDRKACGIVSIAIGAVGSILLFLGILAAVRLPFMGMGAVVQ